MNVVTCMYVCMYVCMYTQDSVPVVISDAPITAPPGLKVLGYDVKVCVYRATSSGAV